jgi:hypothetical protein
VKKTIRVSAGEAEALIIDATAVERRGSARPFTGPLRSVHRSEVVLFNLLDCFILGPPQQPIMTASPRLDPAILAKIPSQASD